MPGLTHILKGYAHDRGYLAKTVTGPSAVTLTIDEAKHNYILLGEGADVIHGNQVIFPNTDGVEWVVTNGTTKVLEIRSKFTGCFLLPEETALVVAASTGVMYAARELYPAQRNTMTTQVVPSAATGTLTLATMRFETLVFSGGNQNTTLSIEEDPTLSIPQQGWVWHVKNNRGFSTTFKVYNDNSTGATFPANTQGDMWVNQNGEMKLWTTPI